MRPHTHISAVHGLAVLLFVIATLGTMHLLALGNDTRFSRAFLALGF